MSRENWEGFVFNLQMCCGGKLGEELQARCVEHHTLLLDSAAASLQMFTQQPQPLPGASAHTHAVSHVQLTVSSSSHFTLTKHQLVKIISPGSSCRL